MKNMESTVNELDCSKYRPSHLLMGCLETVWEVWGNNRGVLSQYHCSHGRNFLPFTSLIAKNFGKLLSTKSNNKK